jgi:hypothetical protein
VSPLVGCRKRLSRLLRPSAAIFGVVVFRTAGDRPFVSGAAFRSRGRLAPGVQQSVTNSWRTRCPGRPHSEPESPPRGRPGEPPTPGTVAPQPHCPGQCILRLHAAPLSRLGAERGRYGSGTTGRDGEAGEQGTDLAAGVGLEIAFHTPAAFLGDLRAGDLSPPPAWSPVCALWPRRAFPSQGRRHPRLVMLRQLRLTIRDFG